MRGLYIHIPFCRKKCKYCDFISFPNCEESFLEYIKALTCEMQEYRGEKVDSVFIGGGTPTLLGTDLLERLMKAIGENFEIAEGAEVSIEANPNTLSEQKLSILKRSGITRLSIGVQSFIDRELVDIGRIHSAAEAEKAFLMAREAGFCNINLDVMFSIPGQTTESFRKTLSKAISLKPEHISCYSLILEEGTPLFREVEQNKVVLPNEETDRDNYAMACHMLKEAGYEQYEISNFARKGFRCAHNLKYWDCEEYIGLGVAAHSYFGGKRYRNTSMLSQYLEGGFRDGVTEELTREDMIAEFMIMGLRKTEGIEKAKFSKRFSIEVIHLFKTQLEKFKKAGLLAENEERIYLTPEGVNLSNSILCEFV